MMIALLSPTLGGGSTVPPWLPPGATAFLDFVNGNYFAGGASRDVADLLGGGFDPGDISASGMFIAPSPTSTNRPKAVDTLFSDIAAGLAAGMTIVFDIEFLSDAYGRIIMIMDADNEDDETEYVNGILGGAPLKKATVEDQIDLSFDDGNGLAAGIHKIAFTFARQTGGNYEYAVSTDGGTAATDTVAYPPFTAIDSILIGHDGLDNVRVMDPAFIRSITLYPAIDPTDLPALTA